MKVTFNVKHLEKNDLHLQGEISPEDLDLASVDELVQVTTSVKYDLKVEELTESIYVHGRMEFMFACQCSRCLKPYHQLVSADDWAWDLPLEGEDKVEVSNDCIDLTPYIREDILLAFPQHPLCKVDCSGLPKVGRSPKSGSSETNDVSSAWAELNKLKF
jgi:uncharacterized protein